MRAPSFRRSLVLGTTTIALLLAAAMPSAAAVTATVNSQGNLTIKGDGGDDSLFLTPGMNPDEVTSMANSPINGGG